MSEYAISTVAMIVFFVCAGINLLFSPSSADVLNLVEGIAALVAAIALALRK